MNYKSLDEALDYLNDKKESLNEGAILSAILAPFFVLGAAILIATLASIMDTLKKNLKISSNPQVTKAITKFAQESQKQILSSFKPEYRNTLKKLPINISDKNIKKYEIKIDLFQIDYDFFDNYYKMTAEYIYDTMDDEDKKTYFEDLANDRDKCIEEILNNSNYFDDGWEPIYDSDISKVKNKLKSYDKKAYNKIVCIDETIKNITASLKEKLHTGCIHYRCSTFDDLVESEFCDYGYITLIIDFVDYSRIRLPEEIENKIEK